MIPEVSKLNWSYEKPTFEEVEGKSLLFYWKYRGDKILRGERVKITDRHVFCEYFDEEFVTYAVIADPPEPEPDPEPMELWGMIPELHNDDPDIHYFHYGWAGWIFETPGYKTRSEAITAWNRIATALNEIGEK